MTSINYCYWFDMKMSCIEDGVMIFQLVKNDDIFYDIRYEIEHRELKVDICVSSSVTSAAIPIFKGIINNKSELKRLLQQLNIN